MESQTEIKFVVDVNVGKLAKNLRMLGFDVVYDPKLHDAELAKISEQEHRILLTRDHGLLKRKNVKEGYFIQSSDPETQVIEVAKRFNLLNTTEVCTRCMNCNVPIVEIAKGKIIDQLPPKVAAAYETFYECPHCHKIYWEGTHFQDMQRRLKKWREELKN